MRTAPMSIGLSMALAWAGVVHAKAVPQCLAFAQPPTSALVLAAAQGNAVAESRLGTDYAHGIAAPKDVARALPLLTAAARQGYAPAQYQLGKLYAHDVDLFTALKPLMLNRFFVLPVMPDDRIAQHWYRRAAQQGYAPAEWARSQFEGNAYLMAFNPIFGHSWQWAATTYQRSLHWLARAAKAGFAPAEVQRVEYADEFPIFCLGLLRKGTPPGTVRFAGESRSFDDAIAQGYGFFDLTIDHSLFPNLVTAPHSRIETANWLRIFLATPRAYSMHGLNTWNPNRQGIPQNPRAALTYIQGKAIAGDAAAIADLGFFYEHSDPALARALFVRAARKGDPAAEFRLGGMLQPNVPPPWPPAKPPLLRTPPPPAAWGRTVALWSKAADQGDAVAEIALANHWIKDEPDDMDAQTRAYVWSLIATARLPLFGGLRESALRDLVTLAPRLSAAQRAAAYAQATRWMDEHGCGPIANLHHAGFSTWASH